MDEPRISKRGIANEGAPARYSASKASDIQLFKDTVEEYFKDCDKREMPYTIPGLAVFLGFEDRHAILDYKRRGVFAATLKKARARIEAQRVEHLVKGRVNPAGLIFDLKNNFGYLDRVETAITGPDGGPLSLQVIHFAALPQQPEQPAITIKDAPKALSPKPTK
jgi:hypothetical protein